MIYENDQLMKLPIIKLDPEQILLSMNISNDILMSILNVNSREVQKAKKVEMSFSVIITLMRLAALLSLQVLVSMLSLLKPIKLLLTDKVVKLFKLLASDAFLSYGHIVNADNSLQPIVVFQTEDVYVATRLLSDETCIQKVKAPCDAMKAC